MQTCNSAWRVGVFCMIAQASCPQQKHVLSRSMSSTSVSMIPLNVLLIIVNMTHFTWCGFIHIIHLAAFRSGAGLDGSEGVATRRRDAPDVTDARSRLDDWRHQRKDSTAQGQRKSFVHFLSLNAAVAMKQHRCRRQINVWLIVSSINLSVSYRCYNIHDAVNTRCTEWLHLSMTHCCFVQMCCS